MLLSFLRKKDGQALVLVAVMIAVLIGFSSLVVDAGTLYITKTQLQNAADAAALAGAEELPKDPVQAKVAATNFAKANKIVIPGDILTITIPPDNKSIKVDIIRAAPLYFAKIFGLNTSNVSATATASIGTAASVPWIVPFVIPKPPSFNYDNVYVMRMYGGGHITLMLMVTLVRQITLIIIPLTIRANIHNIR